MPTLQGLRQQAVNQTLHPTSSLGAVLHQLGFVQADPIRAPARAQDLILRPRVEHYKAGQLEATYKHLAVDEDYFVNYGFLHADTRPLFHPRVFKKDLRIQTDQPDLMARVLEFVQENGASHPKSLQPYFGKERIGNDWGGSSHATTRALEGLHRQGHLRVAWREKGIKVFEAAPEVGTPLPNQARVQGILELILKNYAPLPLISLLQLCSFSGYGAPSLAPLVRQAAKKLKTVLVEGVQWVMPLETLTHEPRDGVVLLAPFDPIVWDRRRFALLHGWEYRFEAYTKPNKRLRGYYALPLLYQTNIIGWANISTKQGFNAELGYVTQPKTAAFKRELNAELERLEAFL